VRLGGSDRLDLCLALTGIAAFPLRAKTRALLAGALALLRGSFVP
jgi:hypothetical protein